MAQIEKYERPFNIVYGTWGEEAKIVRLQDGPDVPVYKARQMTCAMLAAEEQKAQGKDVKEAMSFIRRQFKDAPLGDLVYGMVRRWKNSHGVERFIGVVPQGIDYKDAGKIPADQRPNQRRPMPAHHRPVVIEKKPWEAERERRRAHRQEPKPPQPTEAERIAAKMAKASRDAAEGS